MLWSLVFVICCSCLILCPCWLVVGASDENIVESLLRDAYQGRFLPRRELRLPTTSPIAAARCQRQCMKDRELESNSPAVHHSSNNASSSPGLACLSTARLGYRIVHRCRGQTPIGRKGPTSL